MSAPIVSAPIGGIHWSPAGPAAEERFVLRYPLGTFGPGGTWKPNPLVKASEEEQRRHNVKHGYLTAQPQPSTIPADAPPEVVRAWKDGVKHGAWLNTPQGSATLADRFTDCRIELVTALHVLASHYENRLGRLDPEDRRLAEGDIKHALKIAARWNWNGTGVSAHSTRGSEAAS